MPKFKYKAKDLNNKVIKGVFFAKDEDDLRAIISNLDFYLVSSKKIAESSQMLSFLEKIKIEEIALFCRQLAIMINSGMETVQAIEILKESANSKKLRDILEVAHHDLLQGIMLSESFAKYPKTFPVFFRNMIYIGEISGKQPLVLNKLADYYEKDVKTKRKMKNALTYPAFLIVLAIAVLALMSLYVMPIFKDVFSSLDATLPPITRIVIAVTDWIKNNILIIIIVLIISIVLFFVLKRVKKFRYFLDNIKLKAPIISGLTRAVITSRFTSGFGTLLSSSIPIVDSIVIMSRLLDNAVVEEKLSVTASEIKRGQGIAKSVATIAIFPQMLTEMLSIGEETGQMEEILDRVSSYYDDQVDVSIKKMTSAIEPIMIMIIGGMIVIILLSVFLPMMGITASIDSVTTA